MDRSKKFIKQGEAAYPHLGSLLKEHIRSSKTVQAEAARELGVAANSFSEYFKRQSFQFGILWKLSLVLKRNFVAELGELLPVAHETQKERALKHTLLEKEAHIENLERKIEVYKEILQSKL